LAHPYKSSPRGLAVKRKPCELLDEKGICIPSKTYREEPFSCTRPYVPETCGIFLEMRRKGKITRS